MAREDLDVWVQGAYAGVLSQDNGQVSFTYDAVYTAGRYSPALSVSMPKSRPNHAEAAGRWIDNLLPDNEDVRERWAAAFDERRATAFNLLRHMGQDCAGAVQVMPSGVAPTDVVGGEIVTESEIEQRLRDLRGDDVAWNFANHGGRWSLGGAQGKFALARRPDGSWEEPTGRAASTHIFKVGIHRFAHGDMAEYVTMRAAALLGLRTAHTEMRRYGEQTAMVSQRFDRRVDAASGTVTRLHQEDLCQALGLSRAAKYESDGGPGVQAISALLSTAIDPRDLTRARQLFATALIFNWIVAGTDAHAKNYALIHIGSRVRMAPLYDLTSGALLLPPDEVRFDARLAMRLGRHYKLRDIAARHVFSAVAAVGVDQAWAADTADRLVADLPAATEQALDELADVLAPDVRHDFSSGMAERIGAARRTLAPGVGTVAEHQAEDDPQRHMPAPEDGGPGSPPPAKSIWVTPHLRRGKVIDGHWRARAGRR